MLNTQTETTAGAVFALVRLVTILHLLSSLIECLQHGDSYQNSSEVWITTTG
jgi:hypothetical protein